MSILSTPGMLVTSIRWAGRSMGKLQQVVERRPARHVANVLAGALVGGDYPLAVVGLA